MTSLNVEKTACENGRSFLFYYRENFNLKYISERMYNMSKYIFCILGLSASGKDTVLKKVIWTKINGIYLNKLIPLTSRPPREGEMSGVDYEFLTKEYFLKLIRDKAPGLMEYRSYNVKTSDNKPDVWYYGNMLPSPEFIYNIMIGTLESFSAMINNPNIQKYGYEIIPIFISVSNEERLYRMINRESKNEKPNYREVSRRFLADMDDLKKYSDVLPAIPNENYFINNDLDKTVEAIVSLISKYIKPEE